MLDTVRSGQAHAPHAAPATERFRFSTAGLSPRQALDDWRDRFGRLNEIEPAPGAAFSARVDYWRVGRFTLANTGGSATRLRRTAAHARRDGFDHWVLRVSRHGVVRSRSGDRSYASGPGELVLERLTDPYEDDWSADEWVAAMVAPGVFPALDRGLAALPRGPVPGVRAALLADYLLALDRRLPSLTKADLGPVAEATRAMIAALSPEGETEAERPMLAARLRAEQAIRANLASARLDSRRVATLSGVSRSTLYRMFEPEGGVAAHIRRLRLDAVHAALRDPARRGETIAALAAQAGFHCPASFCRAFRTRFGAAPGEVRDGDPASEPTAPTPSGRDFLDVLFS
jgi:AraC-like DNA-binding protein